MSLRPLAIALLLFAPRAARSAPSPSERPEEVFALVVAHNASPDPAVSPLRYADDDAARMYEWLASQGARVHLLTVLDADSQRVFAGLDRVARPPTMAEVRAAMDHLRHAIHDAHSRGHRAVFIFFYAGHGEVGRDREGAVGLLGGRLSRSDLFREIIARSPADENHVIIDACNSYFMVNRRGERAPASPEAAIRNLLQRESLERYPHTGVVLSTSTMADSHEWARYRSGIFTHQLLSALWGAGDVSGDQRVDYRELGAYIAAANRGLRDQRARIALYYQPPRNQRGAALADLRRHLRTAPGDHRPARGRVAGLLSIPRDLVGHYYLEDDRGVRHAEFHKTGEQPLRIALLDRPYYSLRGGEREALVDLAAGPGDRDAGALTFTPVTLASRGAVEESFHRDLYAVPFGAAFADGHATGSEDTTAQSAYDQGEVKQPPPWFARSRSWQWFSLSVAGAAAAAGTTLSVLASRDFDRLAAGRGLMDHEAAVALQESGNRRQTWAGLSFGLTGAAALAAVLLYFTDRAATSSAPGWRAAASIGPGLSGLTLQGAFLNP